MTPHTFIQIHPITTRWAAAFHEPATLLDFLSPNSPAVWA
jgi:hypothetical protein